MTNKSQTTFFCTECGHESPKWMGQCPACKKWNTFSEEPKMKQKSFYSKGSKMTARPVKLSEVSTDAEERMPTGFEELTRVLGGGIVPGSVVLIGGEPGIGKSTLLLQAAFDQADRGKKVLYVSGEESLHQIRMRADRLGNTDGDLTLLPEINADAVISVMEQEKPDLCIIDSIQTMYSEEVDSSAGSVSQIRECAAKFTICAKTNNISVFLVGHVTKEGNVAGPRILEHMVDTVLYFESSDNGMYRILRAAKNRFGATNEIGVFEMANSGLKEIRNPSEYMLEGRLADSKGSAVTCIMEGTRPMLMEIQGLVAPSAYSMPKRQATGMDYNRLNMLMAVLEKRTSWKICNCDAYVNVAGGMKITDPSADLAVIYAIISSYTDFPLEENHMIFGEVGLSGEVRAVSHAAERVREARKLGFTHVLLPESCLKSIPEKDREGIELKGIKSIYELGIPNKRSA